MYIFIIIIIKNEENVWYGPFSLKINCHINWD